MLNITVRKQIHLNSDMPHCEFINTWQGGTTINDKWFHDEALSESCSSGTRFEAIKHSP